MTSGRVVLISGTSKGIGLALAEHYVSTGAFVFGFSRSAGPQLGARYVHKNIDVYDEAAVKELFASIKKQCGRIDVVVNNAAIGLAALAMITPVSAAHAVMCTNFLGCVLICREAAKLMSRSKAGRIINISSVSVPLLMEGASVYSASKAALVQFTRVFAKEVAPVGITCNVVAPSLVDTDMMQSLSSAAKEKYLRALTIQRCATMADIINAVEFFAREESGYLTGQVLTLGSVS